MSTRSLTIFIDGKSGKEICVLYRHCDGYPSGHGKELKDFLSGFEIVKGIRDTKGKVANGAGCLVAQAVAHFKDGVGQFYVHPAGTRDKWEEYTYTVTAKEGEPVSLEVNGRKPIYSGPVDQWDVSDEGDEE